MKIEKNYLIGIHVVLEVNCLLYLGMIFNCITLDIAMFKWITFIKYINFILMHIMDKKTRWWICYLGLGIQGRKKKFLYEKKMKPYIYTQ